MEITASKKQSVKETLNDIAFDISWAKLSKEYFNLSPSWIYHKIDGLDGNGNAGGFSHEEVEQFKGELYDLSERIRKTADLL